MTASSTSCDQQAAVPAPGQLVRVRNRQWVVAEVTRGEVASSDPHVLTGRAAEMFSRFRARNREEELQLGLLRVPIPAYSETAFREALANALTHRDYTRWGALHVQWHADQLEISSPGGFPEGIRLDNLPVAAPHPRSPLLADALQADRAGGTDRTGNQPHVR